MKVFNSTRIIFFAMLLVLMLFISASSVQAGEVNETLLNSGDDIALSIEDNDQLEIEVESEIGNGVSEQKNQTRLISPTTKMYYNGKYEVTLIDSNTNETLAGKIVNVSIANVDYSVKTNSKGIASFNIKLNPGSYLATANFAGSDDFNASNNISGNVKVLTTIKAKDITKYYKGSKNYQATYLDSKGKVLKNKKVSITVKGKKYTQKTNSKGVASFAINLKPGTYKVATTNPSTGEKITTSFKILTTVSASDIKKVKGDSKNFVAKFLRSNGKALAKQQVRFKIAGKNYYYRTSSSGQVKLSFNDFKKGTYKVICYNKDGLSKTCTVQIFSKASTKITTSSYTFLTNDSKTIKAKFSTALEDSSKSGKVIKLFINGKLQSSKKTNSNGEVSFKLPSLAPGIYEMECDYDGNKFFKYSYAVKNLIIVGTSNAEFGADDGQIFSSFSGAPFFVNLTAGGVPLINKKVSFEVNGETFTNTTDYDGFTSIPINLDVGNYTVNYRFAGDSKINEVLGSSDISVYKRTDTVISGNYQKAYNDTLQTFNVYLKDVNGTPLPYKSVKIVIGGRTYEEMTDINGYAFIKAGAPVGKYSISVVFDGDDYYNPTSKSGSTTVTLSKYANGINEKNAAASNSYLSATRNCQVNDAKIQSLVKSLTKGLTNDMDKAKALFYYVQANIEYDYYFDTHKGAVETLNSKEGNGADQAHLMVAMFRAAGLKARYVHGQCNFYLDKKTYGHIWTQVLVDNTWICADTTDLANRFGSIGAWNVDNYVLLNKYRELPF